MSDLFTAQETWCNFQQLLSVFQQQILLAPVPAQLQLTTLYSELTIYFESQLLPITEQEIPVAIASKMRSYLTEIHRLLKLLQRDLIFWQSTKQPQRQIERRSAVLEKLEAIARFNQSMIEALTISLNP